jgi:antitoxin component HigA of HigAB toxin-antitoxin module
MTILLKSEQVKPMKHLKPKNNKVYLVLLFETITVCGMDMEYDTEECRVITVHSTKEKAEERAEHLRNQYPRRSVSVIRKTLLGKL